MTMLSQNFCKGKVKQLRVSWGESRFGLGIDPLLAFVDKDGAVKTTTKDPQDTGYPQIMTVCHDMVNYPNQP